MDDFYSIILGLLFCLVLIPLGIGMIGYRLGERAAEKRQVERPADITMFPDISDHLTPADAETRESNIRWLLREFQREPMASALTLDQRVNLRHAYRERLASRQSPIDTSPLQTPEITSEPTLETPSDAPFVSPTRAEAGSEPDTIPSHAASEPAPRDLGPAIDPTIPLEEPDRASRFESPVSHGRELDPAIMLLYVGALMIVASGVIYAAYNWSDFSAMAKLGSLIAVTVAFIAAGLGFGQSERLSPAANTFLTIGALLVPTNAIAAWQVLEGANARPAVPLFFGAMATAIVHTAFSLRPGGKLYDYFAVIATTVAALSLPAAIGTDGRWGAPLTLAVIAGIPVLRGQLAQLNTPRLITSVIAAPFTILTALTVVEEDDPTRWVLPVTMATATFALLRVRHFAPQYRIVAEALATVTALAVITSVLIALDVDSLRAWALIALITATAWTVALSIVPMLRQRHIALPMAVESLVAFTASYILFSDVGDDAIAIVVTLVAVTGMSWIGWSHAWRWFLLASAWFLLCAWSAIAFQFGIDDANDINRLRFAALYPIVTMLGAFAVRRWWHPGSRSAAAIPLWLTTLASGAFVIFAGVTQAADDRSQIPAVIVVFAIYAALSLLVAHGTRKPNVLLGYGVIACLAIGLAVEQWAIDDLRLPFYLLGALILALPSLETVGQRLAGMARPLAVFSEPRPRYELVPLGLTAGIAFVGVVVLSLRSIIATYSTAVSSDAEMTTSTWIAHLAIFGVVLGGSLWLGRRLQERPHDESGEQYGRILAWFPITLGALIIASITSMLTRDIVHASWVALIGSILITGVPTLWRTDEPFLRAVRFTLSIGGPVLFAAALLANLDATWGSEKASHQVGQVIVFGGLALLAGTIAIRKQSSNIVYVATASLAISGWFGTRYLDAGDRGTLLGFICLAWIIAGIGVMALSRRDVAFAGFPLLMSALAVSGVPGAIILSGEAASSGEAFRTLNVYWLLSLAGLLFLVSWVYRRREVAFLASGLAMAALLLQIGSRSPDNIHAYTLPIAAWLLGLGLIERKHSSRANGLLGAGAAFLVLPALWMAEQTGEFLWLLVCLIEGIGLFLAGLALRLRVPIAAGVVTLSVLILRMLLDVVNALPNWAALLTAGLVLLIGGTVWISFRDEVRERFAAIRTRLGPLD